jgi:hypothetical protein
MTRAFIYTDPKEKPVTSGLLKRALRQHETNGFELASLSVAIMDSAASSSWSPVLETEDSTILQFPGGLRGDLLVTLEEGGSAACGLLPRVVIDSRLS